LRYFSSVGGSPLDIPLIGGFEIPYINHELGEDESPTLSEIISAYLEDNHSLEDGFLFSYVDDGNNPSGTFCHVWWVHENNVEKVIQIENKKGIKIFPRYYHHCELIDDVDQFCWKYGFMNRQLEDLKNRAIQQQEHLEQQLISQGIDFDEVMEQNPDILNPSVVEWIQSEYQKHSAEADLSVPGDFLKLMVADPYPWDIELPVSLLCKGFWKTKNPFTDIILPISLKQLNHDAFKEMAESQWVQQAKSDILPEFTKPYIQTYLMQSYEDFISEFVALYNNIAFSYADLWRLKEKYLKNLIRVFNTKAVFEKQFVFCQEGGSWRLTFNGKSTGGYTDGGFKYLHFLLQNKHKPLSIMELDKLDGIMTLDQQDKNFAMNTKSPTKDKKDEDYEINPSVATGSGSNSHHANEKKDKMVQKGRLNVRSKITPEIIAQLEAHKAQLEKDIQNAKSEGDNVIYEKLEEELNRIEEYFEENTKKMKSGDTIIKKDPHENSKEFKQIRDKIRIAIVRALDKIKEYDYDAWTHFDKSLYRRDGWCYDPDDNIDWFLGK